MMVLDKEYQIFYYDARHVAKKPRLLFVNHLIEISSLHEILQLKG